MKIGTTTISKAFIGSTAIQKILIGITVIWQSIIYGTACLINNYSQFLQFGYNVLGVESSPIKPLNLYVSCNGRYSDDPWGTGNVYIYGIRASDGVRVLIHQFVTPNSRDWGYTTNVPMDGSVAFKNINFYATNGPKTTSYLTAKFTAWKL
jgi:hypothetical protein